VYWRWIAGVTGNCPTLKQVRWGEQLVAWDKVATNEHRVYLLRMTDLLHK